MKINILTIFPEYFKNPLETSILGRASKKNLINYQLINLRDFTIDKHQTTDDRPFGGGPGMLMMIEPIDKALTHLKVKKGQQNKKIILTSAKGEIFKQELAVNWSKLDELTIICGHYGGVDERVAQNLIDQEVRIGDYVLTGGEGAALVMADAVSRLLPGVLGNDKSNKNESHSKPGLMGHSQYTKPAKYKNWEVPEVLRSGNHKLIKAWKASN